MLRKIFLFLAWIAGAGHWRRRTNCPRSGSCQYRSAAMWFRSSAARMRFVNYCLNCHSAASMRYNRLMDLGLTEQQIRDNLLFAGAKVGDTMTISGQPASAA